MKETAGSTDYLDLARSVVRLSRHLYRTFDAALGPTFGLSTKDFLVLRTIASGEPHPGGVASYLNMPPASVSRVLERLESRQLLVRSVDPDDHRRFILTVTPEGARLVEEIREVMRTSLRSAYAHVPVEAIRSAAEHLHTLNEVIERRS